MFRVFLIDISTILLIIFIIILLVTYFYFRNQYKYWAVRKIPCGKPNFPLGSITSEVKNSSNVFFKKLYDESKYERYYGIWLLYKPVLMVKDPDLIQRILIKNFSQFPSGGNYFDKVNDPFSESLFALEGAKWKNLRAKLSPIFTSGKLKLMFPLFIKASDNFCEVLEESAKSNSVVDVKELSKRYTIEVVLSVVFGIESNFIKNPKSTVGTMAADILKPNYITTIKLFLSIFIPDIARILKHSVTQTNVSDFFVKLTREIVEHRQNYNITKFDAMQSLIDLLKKGYVQDVNGLNSKSEKNNEFTFKDLSSQAVTFLAGGFETTASAIQFALYEMAMKPEIQDAARQEIVDVLGRHGGELTYEAIFEMEYISRIIEETLRKYSIAPGMMRKCAEEFKDPDSDLVIEKDAYLFIPISGLHRDERYYPDPEKFDPERFTEENKALRPKCVYLPFGDGPRFCIGQRFAQLQMKVALIVLLSKFKFEIAEEVTPNPLCFDPKTLITTAKGQTWLKISLVRDGSSINKVV